MHFEVINRSNKYHHKYRLKKSSTTTCYGLQPKTPQTCCKLSILPTWCNLSTIVTSLLVSSNQNQVCRNLSFAVLLQLVERTCSKLQSWGRLFERWITYPVDRYYPVDKSPIQWIAIHRIKKRCAKHGWWGD